MTAPAADAVPRLAVGALLRHDPVRDEEQLLLPERIVRLNGSSAAILRRCDGERTVAEVVRSLEDEFGRTGLGADVEQFLSDVAAKGWVRW
jgi:pyrroloquinoline quinone biosynthesis protein D